MFKATKTTLAEAFDMEDLDSEGWVDQAGFKSALMFLEDVPNDL